MTTLPSFIAFTGVDDPALAEGMRALSARFPIEWGILVDDDQTDLPLFPIRAERASLLAVPGLRWAAHVCGDQAKRIANAPETADVDLAGYARVQVNHSFSGSLPNQVANVIRFGRTRGVRALLQCSSEFPAETRLDWLFDVSFGTGVKPDKWPVAPEGGPFCGYSGGIAPDNVRQIVGTIAAPPGVQFWIDMESGVRTDGRFDLSKCEAVCMAVYG